MFSSILFNVFWFPFVTRYSSCNTNGKSKLPETDTLNSLIVSMCFSILGISIENNISMILLSGLLLGLYNRHYYIKNKNKYK